MSPRKGEKEKENGEKENGEKEKGPGRFPDESWPVLQTIILEGEGGSYLQTVVTRDVSKNHEKVLVWTKIAAAFNEVRYRL